MKRIFSTFAVLATLAAPAASVTCKRQLVPGATVDVYGLPYGGSFHSGGGKTVIRAGLPGVSVRR